MNEKLKALQNMSGEMWTYYVSIETSGSFPNLPGVTTSGGPGSAKPNVAMASGGLVVGPGSGTSDSIMARVSAGEFVVSADAVQQPGVLELLHSLNSGGRGAQGLSGFVNNGTINVYANNPEEFLQAFGEL